MRREAKTNKSPTPYLYDQYNVTFFHMAKSEVKNVLLRWINSFTEAINKHRLPRFIIFVPDDDIITGIVTENHPGVSRTLGEVVSWITGKIVDLIEDKKKEMGEIRSSSISLTEPKSIWIQALERPRAKEASQLLIKKYNDILEETLVHRKANMSSTCLPI